MCVNDCHDMTLAVKVALNPNTTKTTNYRAFTEKALETLWDLCIPVQNLSFHKE